MTNGDATGLSIKDWLAKLDAKLDKLDDKLDTKADAVVVAALQSRIETIERDGSILARRAEHDVSDAKRMIAALEKQQATWLQVEREGNDRLAEWFGWRKEMTDFRDSIGKKFAAWSGGAVVVGGVLGYVVRMVWG